MTKKIISVLLCISILLSGFTLSLAADAESIKFTDDTGYFKYADGKITYNNLKQTEKPSVISSDIKYFENGVISFEFTTENSAQFGIRFRDTGTNYYFLRLDPKMGNIYLYRAIGGEKEKVVKKTAYNISSGKKYTAEIKLLGKDISISLNDKEVLTYEDKYMPEGGFSFTAEKGKITVSNIKYEVDVSTEYEGYRISKDPVNIYIGLDGNDYSGNGSYDKPYKTVEKAQLEARKSVQQLKPVNIIFKEGIYPMEKPFTIDSHDSGLSVAPVTYMAEEGKEVKFYGGTKLNPKDFKVTTDTKITERLYPEAVGKVYQVDLGKYGITKDQIDWTLKFKTPGSGVLDRFYDIRNDVFINGRLQTLSRWPNDGYVDINGCTKGSTHYTDTNYARISFEFSEPTRWTKAENAFIGGFLMYEWYRELIPLGHIDTENMEIVLGKETTYGVGSVGNWAVYNLVEEIDIPGEYYIDFETMTMYIYLNEKPKAEDVIEISSYNGNFINIGDANYVTIKGLTFDKSAGPYHYSEGAAISIQGEARKLTIEDCTFSYIATQGIKNELSYTNADMHIKGCDFIEVDRYALNIGGGNLAEMIPFTATVENCMFYNSFVLLGYQSDADINGRYHDITMKHNLFADTVGFTLFTDQHYGEATILYNEFSHCTNQLSDMSVIYSGRNPSGNHGTTIEYNLFHHYGKEHDFEVYAAGVYLDDGSGGGKYNYNIFYPKAIIEKNSGYYLTQGPDVEVKGNTFVECGIGVVDMNRPLSSAADQWNNALSHAMRFDSFLEKYPVTQRYFDIYDRFHFQGVSRADIGYEGNNVIIDNLSVNSLYPRTTPDLDMEFTPVGTLEDPVAVNDKSIFVDAENMDFRVSFEAKEKYPEIPDEVLDESFDYNLIGLQRSVEVDENLKNFNMTLPLNGQKNMYFNRVNIAWEKSQYGSEYIYEVATDKEFKNIVKTGKTFYSGVTLTDLKPDTDYYARVKAVSYMRKDGYEVYNQNGVQHFRTSGISTLSNQLLNEQLDILEKEILPEIKEGTKAEDYAVGTRDEISGIIKEGRAIAANTSLPQSELDGKAYEIKEYISKVESKKVNGYATLALNKASSWIVYDSSGTVSETTEGIKLYAPTINTFTFDEVLSNANLYNFKFKISNWTSSFFTFGLRAQQSNVQQWSDACYYVLVKPDVIEVQKQGHIYYTINNTFFENDKEYDIQFGAFTTTAGVNVYMSVDGKKIVDFVDTDIANAQLKEGKLSLMVPDGATVTLAEADSIPEGVFNYTEDTAAIIKYGGHLLFGAEGAIKSESWQPTGYVNLLGYKEYTTADGSEITFNLTGDGVQIYKVYYWNNPKETNDKNVAVSVSGFEGAYQTTVDLTQGEEGWVPIGTFMFKSESAQVGKASVVVKGSGNGEVPMSAIRIHKVENELHPNMLLGQ